MMQSRRWWTSVAVVLALATGTTALAAPFVKKGEPDTKIKTEVENRIREMAKANADAGRKIAQDIVDTAKHPENRDVNFMIAFVQATANAVDQHIMNDASATPEAPLNGVLAVSQIQLAMVDPANPAQFVAVGGTLSKWLGHPNPAVRYWAAKTLAAAIPKMNPALLERRDVIAALQKQVAVETAPLAKAQMVRALGSAGLVGTVTTSVEALASGMRTKAPSAADLEVATINVKALEAAIRSAGDKIQDGEKNAAVSAATAIMSLAAQHAFNERIDSDLQSTVNELAIASVRAINAAAGKATIKEPSARDDKDSLLLRVNEITGSSGPGEVQRLFASVPVPPRIK